MRVVKIRRPPAEICMRRAKGMIVIYHFSDRGKVYFSANDIFHHYSRAYVISINTCRLKSLFLSSPRALQNRDYARFVADYGWDNSASSGCIAFSSVLVRSVVRSANVGRANARTYLRRLGRVGETDRHLPRHSAQTHLANLTRAKVILSSVWLPSAIR